jgi:LysM repeat protein
MRRTLREHFGDLLQGLVLAVVITLLGLASTQFGSTPHHFVRSTSTAEVAAVHQVEAVKPHTVMLAAPTSYQVRAGDTLSIIAASQYGNSSTWPALWWINRKAIPNPNSLQVGQTLKLSSWHPTVSWLLEDALAASGSGAPASIVTTAFVKQSSAGYSADYSFSGLEALWVGAGGPASVESSAAAIAECESGGSVTAYNHSSGASGLWQILGAPQNWTGSTDWFNPYTNAQAAVAKFKGAGDTFAPWVCQA